MYIKDDSQYLDSVTQFLNSTKVKTKTKIKKWLAYKWFVKWKRWNLLTCSIVLQRPQQANLLPDIWRQSSFLFQRKVFVQNRRHNHQVEDSWRVRKYRLVWFRMRAIQWHVGLLLEAKWRRFYIQPWMPHQLYQEQSIEKQGRIELFFSFSKKSVKSASFIKLYAWSELEVVVFLKRRVFGE